MSNLDHAKHAADREAFEAKLEEYGVDNVRAMLAQAQFPASHNLVVLEWLKNKKKDG